MSKKLPNKFESEVLSFLEEHNTELYNRILKTSNEVLYRCIISYSIARPGGKISKSGIICEDCEEDTNLYSVYQFIDSKCKKGEVPIIYSYEVIRSFENK